MPPRMPLDQNQVGLHFGDVAKHLLESGPLVGMMPLAVVSIFFEDAYAIFFGILPVA